MSTYINENLNSRYAFKAPSIESDANKETLVPFPTSEAKDVTLSNNKASVTVERATTILKLGTLAAASELTLTAGADLKVGDLVLVVWTEAATAVGCAIKHGTTTLISATNAKGSNSAQVVKQLVWDSSSWLIL